MAQNDRTHEGRLSALEQGYENLRGEIHGLRTDLRQFMSEARTERRTQWSPIIAGVAVIVAIVGGLSQGPIGEIRRLDTAVTAMQGDRFTNEDGEKHEERIERLEALVHAIGDEDFNRPEAEHMKTEIMEELKWVRDTMFRLHGSQPREPGGR